MSQSLNKRQTLAGITYNSLHWWIRRELGSANKCENPKCRNESEWFVWALIKGKNYDRKKENFMQLCRKCHFDYDLTDEWKQKFNEGRLLAQKVRIGSKHTEETRKKIKLASKNKFPNGRLVWNKGKPWSEKIKEKMSLAKQGFIPHNKGVTKLSKKQADIIRNKYRENKTQKHLAEEYKVSQVTIFNIIHNKICV